MEAEREYIDQFSCTWSDNCPNPWYWSMGWRADLLRTLP